MASGRMLKKKISKSRKLPELPSDSERLFYTWLIPHLDVEGRASADPDVLKGEVVPRLKNWTAEKVKKTLEILSLNKLINLYSMDGDQFLELIRFKDEQRLDSKREAKSQYPEPPSKRKPLLKADYEYLWDIWKQNGMICPECKRKGEFVAERGIVADGYIPFHIDHVIPTSKGGSNDRENLRVVCRECNLKKGNDIIPELLQSPPELIQTTPPQVKLREDKISKVKEREYVRLTPDQLEKLKKEFSEDRLNWMFDKLNFWASTKKKVVDGYAYFKKGSWLIEEMEKKFYITKAPEPKEHEIDNRTDEQKTRDMQRFKEFSEGLAGSLKKV